MKIIYKQNFKNIFLIFLKINICYSVAGVVLCWLLYRLITRACNHMHIISFTSNKTILHITLAAYVWILILIQGNQDQVYPHFVTFFVQVLIYIIALLYLQNGKLISFLRGMIVYKGLSIFAKKIVKWIWASGVSETPIF